MFNPIREIDYITNMAHQPTQRLGLQRQIHGKMREKNWDNLKDSIDYLRMVIKYLLYDNACCKNELAEAERELKKLKGGT